MKFSLALLLALTIPLTTFAARFELAPEVGDPGGGGSEIPAPAPVVEPPSSPAPTPVEPPPATAPAAELPPEAPTVQPPVQPRATAVVAQAAALNLPALIQYLQTNGSSSPEWAALGLSAANASTSGINPSTSTSGTATDLARRILALAAVGENPTALADTLATKLTNGSIGGNAFVNDDVFALLAFRAAGWSASNSTVQAITTFVKNTQRADGGWGVTTASLSDVDSTAAALQALHGVGVGGVHRSQGLAYLHGQQRADGGFPFRLPSTSNSASTAWVLSTLYDLGESLGDWLQGGNSPRDFLITSQNANGGFGLAPGDTSTVLLSSYALLALSNDGFIVRVYTPPVPPAPPAPDPTPEPTPAPAPTPAPTETPAPVAAIPVVTTTPATNTNTTTYTNQSVQVLAETSTLPVTGTQASGFVWPLLGFGCFMMGLALWLYQRQFVAVPVLRV